MIPMSELAGLVELSNQYTGLMLAILWLSAGMGYRLLKSDIEDNGEEIETLHDEHGAVRGDLRDVKQDVNRVDQKQDHIVNRQEMVLERVGMTEQEITDLREETARLDGIHDRSGGD